jgi:hypothetical protein
LTPPHGWRYLGDVPIIRKVFRHSNGVCVVLPPEVRTALGVVLGDYIAWRIEEGGVVRLVSLEEEFRARDRGERPGPGFIVPASKSPAPLRRGG